MSISSYLVPAKGRAKYKDTNISYSSGAVNIGSRTSITTDTGGTSTQGTGTTTSSIKVINNLISTSSSDALSAYQGKVLNDKIAANTPYNIHTKKVVVKVKEYSFDEMVITAETTATTSTTGTITGMTTQWITTTDGEYIVIHKDGSRYTRFYKERPGDDNYEIESYVKYSDTSYTYTDKIVEVKYSGGKQSAYVISSTTSASTTAPFDFYDVDGAYSTLEMYKEKYYTLIDNFSTSLLDSSNYKIFLLRWKKHPGEGSDWRVPAFSPLWNTNLTGTIANQATPCSIRYEDCCWNITGGENEIFPNTHADFDRIFPMVQEVDNNVLNTMNIAQMQWNQLSAVTASTTEKRKRFKSTANLKMKWGFAIYKYTGVGTKGWQRVSNIAPMQAFVHRSGSVGYEILPFE